jgi:hypothetical protein
VDAICNTVKPVVPHVFSVVFHHGGVTLFRVLVTVVLVLSRMVSVLQECESGVSVLARECQKGMQGV